MKDWRRFTGYLGKDYVCRNLLAKQGWRLVNQPGSLLARFLKSRYFPNGNFLSAVAGTWPSFAWRSLLFGRDQLSKGLKQEIGNRRSTKVWLDKWVDDRSLSRLWRIHSELLWATSKHWPIPLRLHFRLSPPQSVALTLSSSFWILVSANLHQVTHVIRPNIRTVIYNHNSTLISQNQIKRLLTFSALSFLMITLCLK